MSEHATLEELEAALDEVRRSPTGEGPIEMIVRRPRSGEREVVDEAELDLEVGLVGDVWLTKGSSSTSDGTSNPGAQITLMNARVVQLLARDRERWPLAGDQFYVDLDLSDEHLPPGTRLALGSAELEISEVPHTGCAKFIERFGRDAQRFVNSGPGKSLRLRGVNARVLKPGRVKTGDAVRVVR